MHWITLFSLFKHDADIKCMYDNMQFLNQEISKNMQMSPVPCDTVIKISRQMVSHARLHEMAWHHLAFITQKHPV